MQHLECVQQDDCGVVCVAMVAGVTYHEALKACFPDGPRRSYGMTTSQILKALARLRIYVNQDRLHRLTARTPAGVKIIKCDVQKDRNWHWIVEDERGRLLDPSRPKRIRISTRGCTSYLAIPARA